MDEEEHVKSPAQQRVWNMCKVEDEKDSGFVASLTGVSFSDTK